MTLDPDEKIDWFRIIEDLRRRGYTLVSIACAVEVPRTTVHGWKMGAAPKWEDGERLLTLWRQVMIPPAPPVPKVRRYSYRS